MSATSRPRVLIADDHILIAEALETFLADDFDVIGIVHDGHRLIQAAANLRPDVILADIGMPLLNGLDAAERIKRLLPDVKLIYVTVNRDPALIAEAFRRQASGYLLKTAAASELVTAINEALQGKLYVSPSLVPSLSELTDLVEEPNSLPHKLTERQIEVLQLLAEGRSMKEAAAVLNLTARTVAFHKYRIMHTLSLHNDAEVVQYAMRKHIVFG
jgi:DNA-binding NarL/FixJ family response regulator